MQGMKSDDKKKLASRLARIEGQVRGLARMIEDERYCIDIITQVQAVTSALRGVESLVLKDHVSHCVEHAIASGDKATQRQQVAELLQVLGHLPAGSRTAKVERVES